MIINYDDQIIVHFAIPEHQLRYMHNDEINYSEWQKTLNIIKHVY